MLKNPDIQKQFHEIQDDYILKHLHVCVGAEIVLSCTNIVVGYIKMKKAARKIDACANL